MNRVYQLAQAAAWPASAWFVFESAVRTATGDPAGGAIAAGYFGLAVSVLYASRLRLAQAA